MDPVVEDRHDSKMSNLVTQGLNEELNRIEKNATEQSNPNVGIDKSHLSNVR